MRARHRLSKLLLRHGIVYDGGKAWTQAHDYWLWKRSFPLAGTQGAFVTRPRPAWSSSSTPGARLSLHVDDHAVEFVQIVMPFARPQFPTEVLTRMAHEVGSRQKIAKVVLLDEAVLVSVEAVVAGAGHLPSIDTLAPMLVRLLDNTVAAGARWREEVVLAGVSMAE